jgi:beta-lactamase superfamily II metal-dependent hydrolase
MSVGVHVLGPGYGESIVLELPDGQLGVIDAFQDGMSPPPVLQFVQERWPGKQLLFLAVTHPHADHCRGVTRLCEQLDIGELWVFASFPAQSLQRYFNELCRRGGRDRVEEALRLPPGSVSLELLSLHQSISIRRRRSSRPRPRFLRSQGAFLLCDRHIVIHFLTPGDEQIHRYQDALDRNLQDLLDGPATVNPDWVPSEPNHNLASGALLLQYGKTRILLMADAETPLWQEWLAEMGHAAQPDLDAVHFVKVAHHGSQNGYWQPLYDALCRVRPALAVITPFRRHRSPLPSREGPLQIHPRVTEVLCTNRTAAAVSSGLTWQSVDLPVARGPAPALPPQWQADCRGDLSLQNLLAQPRGRGASASAPGALPGTWIREILQRPELLRLLRPEVRDAWVTGARENAHDEFRVSVYFDDQGREERSRRYIGPGAGRLVLSA